MSGIWGKGNTLLEMGEQRLDQPLGVGPASRKASGYAEAENPGPGQPVLPVGLFHLKAYQLGHF